MKHFNWTKKTKIIVSLCMAGVVVVGGGVTVVASSTASSDSSNITYKETTVEQGNIVVGVTESGSVTLGEVTQDFDLDESSSGGTTTSTAKSSDGSTTTTSTTEASYTLEVEEVYVTAGTVVNEGDALLKITDDSIEDYRDYLQGKVDDAKLAVSEAQLSAKSTELKASYNYDTNIANGTVAQSEYDSTITELQNAVTSAQEALDESSGRITTYQTYIAAGQDYSAQLAEEQVTYATLAAKLQSAQNKLTTGTIQAQEDYEEAMLNYNNASSQKTLDSASASDTVSNAQDDLEDAQDTLADFEDIVGDGTIYADYTGTIISLGYAAGDTLSSSTSIATYADSDAVTLAVSVSEEDVTAVSVGDSVNIELAAYEGEEFEGEVTSIDTSTSSGSSTVDYTVTVTFTGDVSKIYADMTGDVTFVTKEVDDVLYVSDKAIIADGTKSYVDVKDDSGNISRVEVTTGFSNGENVEIQSGLEAGQTVLIESQVSAQ